MVEALDGNAKAAFAQKRHDFVAIGNVVFDVNPVVPFGVIEAEIVVLLFACSWNLVFFGVWDRFYFLSAFTEVINLRKVKDLHFFILSQYFGTEVLKALSGCHRQLEIQLLRGGPMAEGTFINRLVSIMSMLPLRLLLMGACSTSTG